MIGDLVWWCLGSDDTPGLVLDVKPAKSVLESDSTFNARGDVVLVMLKELKNVPEWFHECELETIDEQ